jgi:hypothetical protein
VVLAHERQHDQHNVLNVRITLLGGGYGRR